MTDIHQQRILILDFGSQYTQLIARRVRELGVYSELLPCDADEAQIRDFKPTGIILSGGPESVTETHSPRAPQVVFELACPILGICYGMQTMAEQLGGRVANSKAHSEFGYAELCIAKQSPLFKDINDAINAEGQALLNVWMSHGDYVAELPLGFVTIANTSYCQIAAMANVEKHYYGLQFHPEVTHTAQGKRILSHFVHEICGCASLWNPENIIQASIAEIRATVGEEQVLLGLSGGVDSSVVAALLYKAIGDQLTCVFVDTGLLRLHEGDQVMQIFAEHLGVKVIRVNATEQFYQALSGVADPEQKRKIIGKAFVDIFEAEAAKLSNVQWLAQGTIYPDIIESAGKQFKKAHLIKSHHNVGGLPEEMKLKLVEPLKELFKDEVRQLGMQLGLPSSMVYRHPFPGPGLGVRVLGEVKAEYVELLQKADAIFIEELRKANLYDKVSQAFVVFLPVKSVGVKGDARSYDYVVALRAVETIDFMTAHWAHLPYDFLAEVSNRIMNEIKGISRVVYDISGKPPSTIEWE